MLTTVLIIVLVVVGLLIALLVLRSRSGRDRTLPPSDPHTHARDNTDPARAIDQLRSQGNSGGVGGGF